MKMLALILFGLVLPCFAQELAFVETFKELTVKPEERRVTVDFEFENKSNQAVTISKYDSSCSCVSVQVKGGKLHYASGEKGMIRGVFDMGNLSGTVEKAIQVWLKGDGEVEPSIALTVRIEIPVLVEISPKTLRWDIGAVPDSKVIEITMNHDQPITVKSATCSNENFLTVLKVVEEGKKYQLVVTPQQTGTPGIGVINISTDCEVARQATQRAFTVIRKPPAVVPAAGK